MFSGVAERCALCMSCLMFEISVPFTTRQDVVASNQSFAFARPS